VHPQLARILAEKRKEVLALKHDPGSLEGPVDILAVRDFKKAISKEGHINLIAEIKFASPSAGLIRKRSDVVLIGRKYEEAGAAAISLLTDQKFFGGKLQDLPRLKRAISLPVLRKDFIMEEIQVKESASWGADAVLLIVRILSHESLRNLLAACREMGIAALTEIHDRYDLDKAVNCGADIIGINNRDLDTFEVDLTTTMDLVEKIPKDHVIVSESGIIGMEDIFSLKGTGVSAVLVGSSLMQSDDPYEKAKELVVSGLSIRGADHGAG